MVFQQCLPRASPALFSSVPVLCRRVLKLFQDIGFFLRRRNMDSTNSDFAKLTRQIFIRMGKRVRTEDWDVMLRSSLEYSQRSEILDEILPHLQVRALYFLKKATGLGHEALMVHIVSADGSPFATIMTDRNAESDSACSDNRLAVFRARLMDPTIALEHAIDMPSPDSGVYDDIIYTSSSLPRRTIARVVRTSSGSSSMTYDAGDWVMFWEGNVHDKMSSYDCIEHVMFQGRRPTLLDFFLVVCATHTSCDTYRLLHQQCFWYADVVSKALQYVVGTEACEVVKSDKPNETKVFSPSADVVEKLKKIKGKVPRKVRKGCWMTIPLGEAENQEVEKVIKRYEVLREEFSAILEKRDADQRKQEETRNLMVALEGENERYKTENERMMAILRENGWAEQLRADVL